MAEPPQNARERLAVQMQFACVSGLCNEGNIGGDKKVVHPIGVETYK
jgi:hypothetical protein